jgi:hypothetical protein
MQIKLRRSIPPRRRIKLLIRPCLSEATGQFAHLLFSGSSVQTRLSPSIRDKLAPPNAPYPAYPDEKSTSPSDDSNSFTAFPSIEDHVNFRSRSVFCLQRPDLKPGFSGALDKKVGRSARIARKLVGPNCERPDSRFFTFHEHTSRPKPKSSPRQITKSVGFQQVSVTTQSAQSVILVLCTIFTGIVGHFFSSPASVSIYASGRAYASEPTTAVFST